MGINTIELQLKEAIIQALQAGALVSDIKPSDIIIEIPKDSKNGDYATNVAMRLTRELKQNPRVIAQTIVDCFDLKKASVERIEIAGPGFLNFFMDSKVLGNVVAKIITLGHEYGKIKQENPIKINVEYVSANPTGDLHLGHARQASLGDSITRILKAAGYDVTREYYINDAGNQIHNLAISTICRYHQAFGIDKQLPDDGYYGADIINIANNLKEIYGDKFLNDESEETYNFIKEFALEYELVKLKNDLKFFRAEFDVWTSENKLYADDLVAKAITTLEKCGYVYEQDGATWLKTTAFNDDKDRVLKKSDGSYTYLTPDIANHIQKLETGVDYMVNLWGADHHGYIPRMKAAMQMLGKAEDCLEVDIVQMVRLVSNGTEVKMSKRTGNAITLRDLCEETSTDAVRYFFASRSGATHFDFDLDLATSKSNDNPVYYVQYAHARMASILEKAKDNNISYTLDISDLTSEKEVDLIKHLNEFESEIINAAKTRLPHKMVNYAHKLATLFHSFYNESKVIDLENLEQSSQRLALVLACKITLANALELIGVEAKDNM